MVDIAQVSSVAPAIAGAAAGGVGAAWLARLFFTRMLTDYDKKHADQAAKLDLIADKFRDTLTMLQTKVAVIEALLSDNRASRAEAEAKMIAVKAALETVSDDIWVAHRRIEALSRGERDISKIQRRGKG